MIISKVLEGNPSLFQHLAAPGAPWLVAAGLQSLPLSSNSLIFYMSSYDLLIKTLIIDLGHTLIQDDLVLTTALAKALFPNKITSEVPNEHEFLSDTIQHSATVGLFY